MSCLWEALAWPADIWKRRRRRGISSSSCLALAAPLCSETFSPLHSSNCCAPGIAEVYNTGDLASRASDGRIHYHGRVDWQVKVRGIRIELEALEQDRSAECSFQLFLCVKL